MVRLFALRVESGDVHPPYSSFRADPLGVRALYEALASLPGISVQRNLDPIRDVGSGRDKTLFIAGADVSEDPVYVIAALDAFVATGGRLVVTFHPFVEEPFLPEDDKKARHKDKEEQSEEPSKKEQKDKGDREDRGAKDEDKTPGKTMVSIEDRWGFSCAYAPPPGSTSEHMGEVVAVRQGDASDFPERLSWHTALYFDALSEMWRPLYSWNGHVVVMDRNWGKGTMVLCSDSFFLSNEAMQKERYSYLLAWLVGPSAQVVFDETHLGIQQRAGVISLVRKYRLDGLIIAFVIVAALFVWKHAASLVPKRESVREAIVREESRDSTAGLVNLLRRSVSSRRILAVCVEEWFRAAADDSGKLHDKAERVRAIMEADAARPLVQRNPVAAYRDMCAAVAAGTPRAWPTKGKEQKT
jgi:hypothetical protein